MAAPDVEAILTLRREAMCTATKARFSYHGLEQQLEMDTTKFRRELGYHETLSRRDALARTAVWKQEHWPQEVDPA